MSKPESYIDYYGDSSSKQTSEYTPTHFYDYWRKQLIRHHRMAALPITIKEKSLWKRLIAQYEPEDLIAMIDKWMKGYSVKSSSPANFTAFYITSSALHTAEKDYTWD